MLDWLMPDASPSRRQRLEVAWRRRYEGSIAQDVLRTLNAVDFGRRIVVFGASMLLSVLPLVVLVSAFANRDVDNSISQRLGLSHSAAQIIDGLFTTSPAAFNSAIVLALVISLVGTISLARSVQEVYERAFDSAPTEGKRKNLLRSAVWVISLAALLLVDTAISRALRDLPAGRIVLGSVDFAALALFFWWSVHFLLAGREPWRRIAPSAIATALFWLGFGVFASFYFSPTIVSDSRLYGTIGVVFSLLTWFIGIGAVITLGAVVGVVWNKRTDARRQRPAHPRELDHAQVSPEPNETLSDSTD
jgi:membrane protein